MNNYYWYYHIHPEEKSIHYVGVGSRDRAWVWRSRQPDHIDWLELLHSEGFIMSDIVEIGDTGISRREALDIELQLINEHRPKFNRNFRMNDTCILTKKTFQVAVELRKDGKTYENIADELGTSVMTIHRALNGGTKKYAEFIRTI